MSYGSIPVAVLNNWISDATNCASSQLVGKLCHKSSIHLVERDRPEIEELSIIVARERFLASRSSSSSSSSSSIVKKTKSTTRTLKAPNPRQPKQADASFSGECPEFCVIAD